MKKNQNIHGSDTRYMRALRSAACAAGFEMPLYACNSPRVVKNGFIPELFQTANFGADPEQRFALAREVQPKGPLMCAEYYPAWFDTWGQAHHPPKNDRTFFGPIDWMFAHRASFSLYMAHGGTSFGGWSGCRHPVEVTIWQGRFLPVRDLCRRRQGPADGCDGWRIIWGGFACATRAWCSRIGA